MFPLKSIAAPLTELNSWFTDGSTLSNIASLFDGEVSKSTEFSSRPLHWTSVLAQMWSLCESRRQFIDRLESRLASLKDGCNVPVDLCFALFVFVTPMALGEIPTAYHNVRDAAVKIMGHLLAAQRSLAAMVVKTLMRKVKTATIGGAIDVFGVAVEAYCASATSEVSCACFRRSFVF